MLLKNVKMFVKIDYLQYANFVDDRLFNDFRYSINNDKLKQLGWDETIDFSIGLKDTIEWYKTNTNFFK